MKIPESIIAKYQLVPTDNHIGEAVIHNQMCFKSSLPGFAEILFMECDFMGKPSKYIHFYSKNAKREGTITPEFMEGAPTDVIFKMVS